MFLGLRTNRAVINQRTAGDCVFAIVNKNGRVYEVSIGVQMPGPNFSNLARSARHRILMAINTDRGIVDGAQTAVVSFTCFEISLIDSKGVVWRLRYAIADTFGARILGECWRCEPRRRFRHLGIDRFPRGLLRQPHDQRNRNQARETYNWKNLLCDHRTSCLQIYVP